MDLGEHIELVDYVEHEPGELVIVKKIVGHAAKHLMERLPGFERLSLTFKSVHGRHTEVHGRLRWSGHEVFCDYVDENRFFALDGCLKKLANQAR